MNDRRIAVSGSAGIGKSTLCDRLASAFGYPLIPDVIDTVLKAHGYGSWGDGISPAEAVDIRLDGLKRKIESEKDSEVFISDKSVIDYLAYWDLNTASKASREDCERFESTVANHLGRYDLILLLLWGRMPIRKLDRRRADRVHQFRVHSAITRRMLQLRAPFVVFDQFTTPSDDELCERITDQYHSAPPDRSRQVGLFIGTFDPPTNGHLKCAIQALELLDEVWFCPNPDNPHCKRRHLPVHERVKMLELVVRDKPGLCVYVREHNAYVNDPRTVRPRLKLLAEVRRKNPLTQFWVLLGTDKLRDEVYKAPEPEIQQTGHIVFERSDPYNLDVIKNLDLWVALPKVGNESSTEVKKRVSQGDDVWDLVPRSVGEYINTHDVYRMDEQEA